MEIKIFNLIILGGITAVLDLGIPEAQAFGFFLY